MAKQASAAARRRAARQADESTGTSNRVVNLPDGVEFFKVEDDTPKRFDILNYTVKQEGNPCAKVGDEYFERTYYRHGKLGPDGKGMAICLKKTYGERCPVCEYLSTVDWKDENQRDANKPMNPKERQLFNVYDTSDGEGGVKVWEVSYHLFGKQLDKELENADEDDGVDDFSSHSKADGRTLKVAFSSASLGDTTYYEASSINFKNRTTDHKAEGTKVYDLDAMLSHPTYDEVKAIMEGRNVASNASPAGDDETEAAPTQAQAAPEKEESGPVCPQGGVYGKDVDKFGKKCEECKLWNDCDDAAAAQ